MDRLVLTDASPLIGLDRVDGLGWLQALFGRVEMTSSVFQELVRESAPGAGIAAGIDEGWLVARKHDPKGPARPSHLGAGEWSTILAARARDGPCLVLIDDRLARREAQAAGVTFAGTAAVIGMACERGLIPSARKVFERLLQSDFRISPDVIRTVLERRTESQPSDDAVAQLLAEVAVDHLHKTGQLLGLLDVAESVVVRAQEGQRDDGDRVVALGVAEDPEDGLVDPSVLVATARRRSGAKLC